MDENQVGVPDGIKKWNWGAFSFSLFWGIGNQVYISLLCLIPFVNIVMMIILGIKGNEWAWKNGSYRDVEEFKKAQSSWNRAGIVMFIVMIISIIFYFIFAATLMTYVTNSYNPYY